MTSLENDKAELLRARPPRVSPDTNPEAVPDANDAAAAHEPLGKFEQLPVTLTFDLGTKTVALTDLRSMQAGQAIDLEQGLDAPVRIRANGLLIGQGDLVEIDGALGVVVAELFESAAQ